MSCNGYRQKEIAEQFGIGCRTLKEWLFRKRVTGDIQAKKHIHRGLLPIIDKKGLLYIKKLVEKKPDIIISELRVLYGNKFKITVAVGAMSNALAKLNFRRKKKSKYASEQEREDVKKNVMNGKRRWHNHK